MIFNSIFIPCSSNSLKLEFVVERVDLSHAMIFGNNTDLF